MVIGENKNNNCDVKLQSDSIPVPNVRALLPIVVFLIIYLGNGIWFEYIQPIEGKMGFHVFSVVVSFGIALIVAFLQNRRLSFDEKIHICSKGIGNENIIVMLLVFLLAGAFSGVSGAAGGALSMANMLLNVIPPGFAVPGLFIIACLVSIAMGTSIGTITVLAPVAVVVAKSGGLSLPLCAGTVVGGAMFGDNLSFISDTTIAATKTQGVKMKDKFLTNVKIALPAAIITLILLIFLSAGGNKNADIGVHKFNFFLTLPYFVVLVMALIGLNVLVVLLIGVILFVAIGISLGNLDYASAFISMGDGTVRMFETMIVTMLVASICALIKAYGGFEAILSFIRKHVSGRRGGMIGIALLTASMVIATANNTLAIIVAAPIARDISDEFGVPRKTTASLLDTCSCITKGLIPYGSQLLLAGSLTDIGSFMIIPWLFYPFLLLIFVTLSIIMTRNKKDGAMNR